MQDCISSFLNINEKAILNIQAKLIQNNYVAIKISSSCITKIFTYFSNKHPIFYIKVFIMLTKITEVMQYSSHLLSYKSYSTILLLPLALNSPDALLVCPLGRHFERKNK